MAYLERASVTLSLLAVMVAETSLTTYLPINKPLESIKVAAT